MQNDWAKLLLIIEFIDNNTLFSVIFSTSFFLNKDFHSCMSFELNVIEYKSSCKRLQMTKIENIFEHMNKTLKFACESLVKTRKQMMKQVNRSILNSMHVSISCTPHFTTFIFLQKSITNSIWLQLRQRLQI